MATPALVIFDFDGTIATLPVDWYGLKQRLLRFLHEQGIEQTSITFWKDIEQIKQQLSPATLEKAYRCIEGYEHPAVPLMDVNEKVVKYLKGIVAAGGKVAVCSNNMASTVRMGLERLGLKESVAMIVGLDSVGRLKPHPEGVLKILRELQVSASDALFIGDSGFDEEAARSAGLRFTQVDTLAR
jgi:HAD superfamily hydrolase (TIGR01509 family)